MIRTRWRMRRVVTQTLPPRAPHRLRVKLEDFRHALRKDVEAKKLVVWSSSCMQTRSLPRQDVSVVSKKQLSVLCFADRQPARRPLEETVRHKVLIWKTWMGTMRTMCLMGAAKKGKGKVERAEGRAKANQRAVRPPRELARRQDFCSALLAFYTIWRSHLPASPFARFSALLSS